MIEFLGLGLATFLLFAPTTGDVDSAALNSTAVSETLAGGPTYHTGGAYQNEFTLKSSDGVHLNIWMQNNSSVPVQFQVKRNGSLFTDQAISGGAQKTISFQDLLETGLTGTYKVYIYSTTGNPLDITIKTRQF